MTIKTGTHDLRMVDCDGGYWRPGRREFLMTRIAYVTGRDMVSGFTTGRHPIVASNTVTDKRGVINCKRRCPGIGSMAIVTFQRRLNMVRRLTGC